MVTVSFFGEFGVGFNQLSNIESLNDFHEDDVAVTGWGLKNKKNYDKCKNI